MENEKPMQPFGGFEIMAADTSRDMQAQKDYIQLELAHDQQSQINALLAQMPVLTAADTLADAYILKFPDGIPHDLVELKQGGYMSTYRDANGKFAGTASLYPVEMQAVLLQAFSAMSAVTGQYFLAQINSKLSMMKWSIDKILDFLYEEKMAELLSEVSFVRYAYENYSSLLLHEAQRAAILPSLMESRKIATKDIEFYLHDLDAAVNRKALDVNKQADSALQIKESLHLALQLYVTSTLLEVYYAENYDTGYLAYVEKELSTSIGKCEKRILADFAKLVPIIEAAQADGPLKKKQNIKNKKEIFAVVDELSIGAESPMQKLVHDALSVQAKPKELCIRKDGTVYLKTA